MDHEEVVLKMGEHDAKIERIEGRIKLLEKEHEILHKLSTSVAVLAEQMTAQNKKIDVLTGEVQEIKSTPSKRWELFVSAALTAISSAVIGFLFARFGIIV